MAAVKEDLIARLVEEDENYAEHAGDVKDILRSIEKRTMRRRILDQGERADGRALDEAEYDKAETHYSESLPMFRSIHDVTGIACALAGLGNVAWLQGDHERALRLHEEALANFRDSREGSAIGFCLECQAGGVRPAGGLPMLVERHNERLDLPLEEWSKEIIAEAVHRSGTAV